jgi:hypothetical protein
MPVFAIVVEGAHDASFLGQLLKARGFRASSKLSLVPMEWRSLFPKSFPMDGESLERVMRFPEVFINGDISVGITTAGSDSRLISTLRSVIDAIGSSALSGVAVFIDIDKHDANSRFLAIQKQITSMNNAAQEEGQPGYPVIVPSAPGVMEKGSPSLGIFLFPDNKTCGALEDILVECARTSHPDITKASIDLIEHFESDRSIDADGLKNLCSGMGKGKAIIGTIANILKPGSSVASSLAQTKWLSDASLKHHMVSGTDKFVESLLSCK